MCISKSVGRDAANIKYDVKTIQILLNLNFYKITQMRPLVEDGLIGKNTINAIEEFQRRALHMLRPDGRIDPNGKTLSKLRAGMPSGFSEAKLSGILIHAKQSLIKKYFVALNVKMSENQISTPLRMAHFLAQIGHESGELYYSEEIACGDAYEKRKDLGNTEVGDGRRFKGRGLIQITGRANYTKYSDDREIDYTQDKTKALLSSDPATAVDVSCWFWTEKKLNTLADGDDVLKITKRINGGQNGLDARKALLARAKFFLMR